MNNGESNYGNDKIISVTTRLFRYDIAEPPEAWNSSFLNPEYNLENMGLGHKNQAGLYFFSDTEKMVHNLATNALSKFPADRYYLTSLLEPINLNIIDLNPCRSIFVSVDILMKLGIDVLTEDFKMFDEFNEGATLLQLRKIYYDIIESKDDEWIKRSRLVQNMKVDSRSNYLAIGLLGQLLTDFENGPKFVELVKGKYPDVDGYRWREHGDLFPDDPNQQDGFTYCLFNADKLSAKETVTVEVP